MKTIYSLLYGMLVLFSACGQSKVQEKFDTITTYSYTNSYGKDGRLAEVLIKQQSQFLENGAYISGRAVEITQTYLFCDCCRTRISLPAQFNKLFVKPHSITSAILFNTQNLIRFIDFLISLC